MISVSNYEINSGIAFKLLTKVSEGDYEEKADRIYDVLGKDFQINYEGTIAFCVIEHVNCGNDGMEFFHVASNKRLEECIQKLNSVGLYVEIDSARWFSTCHYNDTDSYMSELSLAAFEHLPAT